MDERRYQDDEVRRIFEAAADAPEAPNGSSRRAVASERGLTLTELQDIGREVGMPPGRIAEAARALDLGAPDRERTTLLGLPVSVGRVVDLPRAPTDAEWERLVAELRRTFRAKGEVSGQGGLREWTNGNLHAFVEPGESGYQLRLGTRKGDVVPAMLGGLGVMMLAVFMFLALTQKGEPLLALMIPALFGLIGAGMLGQAALLPSWARERSGQMDHIAERAVALLAVPSEGDGG